MKEKLLEIYKEDSKILDNKFKMENKKTLKRKYNKIYPNEQELK